MIKVDVQIMTTRKQYLKWSFRTSFTDFPGELWPVKPLPAEKV